MSASFRYCSSVSGSIYSPLICFSALTKRFPCTLPTPWPDDICVAYTRNPESPFIESATATLESTSVYAFTLASFSSLVLFPFVSFTDTLTICTDSEASSSGDTYETVVTPSAVDFVTSTSAPSKFTTILSGSTVAPSTSFN